MSEVPLELQAAIYELWNKSHQSEQRAFTSKEFKHLCEVCYRQSQRPIVRKKSLTSLDRSAFGIALQHFFINVGAPWFKNCAAPSSAETAELLWKALMSERHSVSYLIPLDLADELPQLGFGPWRLGTYTVEELASLMKTSRFVTRERVDIENLKRLSRFDWLLLRTEEDLPAPEVQAFPFLSRDLADIGKVIPHPEQFPAVVEQGLFVFILYPWETLSEANFVPWQPFRFPWLYRVPESPFYSQPAPPNADRLSWEPYFFPDGTEDEIPSVMSIDTENLVNLETKLERYWNLTNNVLPASGQGHSAISKSIRHFMLRAFRDDGFDQLLWHMVALEATLGQQEHGSTVKIARRAAALCAEEGLYDDVRTYYDWRSDFIHGRKVREPDIWEGNLREVRKAVRSIVVRFMELCQDNRNWDRAMALQYLNELADQRQLPKK